MNRRLLNAKNSLTVPWALSGSMAMKLYGERYGVATRNPANVNIVVNRNYMANAYRNLSRLVGSHSPPVHTKSKKSATQSHFKLNSYDLLRAGSELAPAINSVVLLNGIPVVPLEALLNYKRRTLRNVPSNANKLKINSNIRSLVQILNAARTSTPLKVVKSTVKNSPKRKMNSGNNFSTPPSTTRKKLAF